MGFAKKHFACYVPGCRLLNTPICLVTKSCLSLPRQVVISHANLSAYLLHSVCSSSRALQFTDNFTWKDTSSDPQAEMKSRGVRLPSDILWSCKGIKEKSPGDLNGFFIIRNNLL